VNRKQEISQNFALVVDGLLLGVLLWSCYLLRISGIFPVEIQEIPPFPHFYWMLALIIPASPLLLDLHGFYDSLLIPRYRNLLSKIGRAGLWLLLLITLISIFGKFEVPSRSVFLLFFLFSPLILLLRVWITHKIFIHHLRRGRFNERSTLVGTLADIANFLRKLTATEKIELQISHWFDLERMDASAIRKNIRARVVERIIFVSPDSQKNEDLPFGFESEGIEIWMLARNINGLLGTPYLQTAGNTRALVFRRSSSDFFYQTLKRSLDIIGALVGILLFSPLALLIALVIKSTSSGAIIFRQTRSGKRGRRFTILKFRSMVADAPQLHAELAHKNEMQGPTFKIAQDPRVTPFGSFLRRSSLDELPQFLNVLWGDMSLVGPRPLPDYETDRIEKSMHRRRLSVKPGLTCLWQIQGRNSISSFEEWMQLDLEYIDKASLLLDLWILLQTLPAVLLKKGAH
jgi:exopolysaccharide biosynthesis polyprenyl glycosylphosphotransferase